MTSTALTSQDPYDADATNDLDLEEMEVRGRGILVSSLRRTFANILGPRSGPWGTADVITRCRRSDDRRLQRKSRPKIDLDVEQWSKQHAGAGLPIKPAENDKPVVKANEKTEEKPLEVV